MPRQQPAKFNLPLPSHQMIERSRQLRGRATSAEQILWEQLRARRLAGLKFRRQHAIGNFIADFFCGEHLLVIELDGAIHQEASQAERDAQRDEIMRAHNLKVLRFSNSDVFQNLPCVLTKITDEAGVHIQP